MRGDLTPQRCYIVPPPVRSARQNPPAMSQMLSALRNLQTKAESFEPLRPPSFLSIVEEWKTAAAPADSPPLHTEPETAPPHEDAEPETPPLGLSIAPAPTETTPVEPAPFEAALTEAAPTIVAAPQLDTFALFLTSTRRSQAPREPAIVPFPQPSLAALEKEATLTPPQEETPSAPHVSLVEEGPLAKLIRENLIRAPRAEQFRAALQAVLQGCPGPEPAAVLLVGVDAGEHAAQAAATLAAALSLVEETEVLLVDADLPARTLSHGFNLHGRHGLTDALQPRANEQDNIPLLYPTPFTRLMVMPAGVKSRVPRRPRADALRSFLASRRPGRVMIVHSGPPEAALTREFAAACDAVYLVIRLGQTPLGKAQAALDALQTAGANIHGCLATNVPDF